MSKIDDYIKKTADEISEFMSSLSIADVSMGVDVSKGKKLRGSLVMLICDYLSGDRKKALEFASAVELIHLGSLTHDDVIDEHEIRRGTIPLHLLKGAKWAVLTGDRMFTLANKLASKSGNKEAIEVAEAMESVLSGVMKEMSLNEFFKDLISGAVSDKFYYKTIGLKTAGLFKSAGRFGAMSVSDINRPRTVDDFGDYGYYVGTAYQIADDLTDIIKMGEGTKDPDIGSIISVIPAVFNYNKDSVKRAPFMIMSGRISVEKILDMITSVDMPQRMKEDIKTNIESSVRIFNGFPPQNDYSRMLNEYPEYCVNQILSEVGEKI